jgi:hypothetical protein
VWLVTKKNVVLQISELVSSDINGVNMVLANAFAAT